MKQKILLFFAAVMCFSIASAQQGQMAAGVNVDMGFGYPGSYSNVGIGAKFQYSITDNIRIEPAFTYFLKKDYISMWDLMANVHYVLPMAGDKLNIYPLAGLGVLGVKAGEGKYSVSSTNFGINLGGGAEYKITEKIALGAEIKYQIVSDYNHLVIQIGATYSF